MRPQVDEKALQRAADLAIDYLDRMPDLPVREEASLDDLRVALRVPLNDAPMEPSVVIRFTAVTTSFFSASSVARLVLTPDGRMLS